MRLISATHRDLKAWSDEGRFRQDLYYRLSVFTIHLPPLRGRDDDLRLLVRYYLQRFSREFGREIHEIDPETLRLLAQLLLAGEYPGAAERAQAGDTPIPRHDAAPHSLPPPLGTIPVPVTSSHSSAADPRASRRSSAGAWPPSNAIVMPKRTSR